MGSQSNLDEPYTCSAVHWFRYTCRYTQVVLHDILHGRSNTVRLVSPPSGRVSWQRYLSLSIYLPSWLSSVMLSWLNILQASLFTPEILLCLGFLSALRLGSVIFTEKQNPFIELGAPCRTVIIATYDLKATVAIAELK